MPTRLELIHGDIMETDVEAIVNPTDLVLSGAGGLDRIIRQKPLVARSIVLAQIFATSMVVVKQVKLLLPRRVIFLQSTLFTPLDRFGPEAALENRSCLRVVTENASSWLWKTEFNP